MQFHLILFKLNVPKKMDPGFTLKNAFKIFLATATVRSECGRMIVAIVSQVGFSK